MKIFWRVEFLQLIVIATMFVIAAWAWPQVPDQIPIHWNFQGEVDGWAGRFVGLLLLPMMALGLYLLTSLVIFIDPGKRNYENFAKAYSAIRLAIVLFMATIYAITVRAAFGHTVNMATIMPLAMGILFVVLGNYMSKLRPNWFVGVRTPWTLSSRLSWDKTHRLAGWLFVVMGLLFFLVAFTQNMWTFVTMLVVDALLIAWTILYSYLIYRHDPHRMSPAGTVPSSEEDPA